MNRSVEEKFDLREEFKLVPIWALVLAGILFVMMQALLFLFPCDPHAPHFAMKGVIGLFAWFAVIFFTARLGNVNRDAKRQGMNYKLWAVDRLLGAPIHAWLGN